MNEKILNAMEDAFGDVRKASEDYMSEITRIEADVREECQRIKQAAEEDAARIRAEADEYFHTVQKKVQAIVSMLSVFDTEYQKLSQMISGSKAAVLHHEETPAVAETETPALEAAPAADGTAEAPEMPVEMPAAEAMAMPEMPAEAAVETPVIPDIPMDVAPAVDVPEMPAEAMAMPEMPVEMPAAEAMPMPEMPVEMPAVEAAAEPPVMPEMPIPDMPPEASSQLKTADEILSTISDIVGND